MVDVGTACIGVELLFMMGTSLKLICTVRAAAIASVTRVWFRNFILFGAVRQTNSAKIALNNSNSFAPIVQKRRALWSDTRLMGQCADCSLPQV